MKKILSVLILFFAYSCSTTSIKVSDNNNIVADKESDKHKSIIFSKDENHIRIYVPNVGVITNPHVFLNSIPDNIVNTAKNHCALYKKNTYIKYNVMKNDNKKYVDRSVFSNDDFYTQMQVYNFRCASSVKKARLIVLPPSKARESSFSFAYEVIGIKEYKRTLSKTEIAANKAKAEKERLAKLERDRIKRQKKIASLEASFGEACTGGTFKKGFTKGTQEYENCLFQKEKEAIAKQKAIDAKLAKMTPVQRREYNCEETFQFRKGSDKFKDCVFKLYTTELELQKLELQKQVAEAKLEAEKAKAKAAATEKARADAVARAQIAAAEAQKAAAKSQSLATSMSLMQLGSSMMSSPAPTPSNTGRVRTTCRNVGGFLNCY